MNIAVAVNQRFLKYLYIMLISLLENNSSESMTIYILSADLIDEQFKSIQELVESYGQKLCFLQMDKEKFPKKLPFNETITIETYFRLMLPELMPQDLDRVLYLDVDLVVNKSLSELFTMDFCDKCFVACRAKAMAT